MIKVKTTAIAVTVGLLTCGLAGYLLAGVEGRNTGSLIGAIAGAIYVVYKAKRGGGAAESRS